MNQIILLIKVIQGNKSIVLQHPNNNKNHNLLKITQFSKIQTKYMIKVRLLKNMNKVNLNKISNNINKVK